MPKWLKLLIFGRDKMENKVVNGELITNVTRVIDGDTFKIEYQDDITGKPLSVRINKIDTPETGKKAKSDYERNLAERARQMTKSLIEGKQVTLKNLGRDKYGRVLCDVFVADINVGSTLIDEGLAVFYDGGTKKEWHP